MFDSIFGEVECSHCKNINEIDIQFKFGSCLLLIYELGDYIPSCFEKGHQVIYDWKRKCKHCNQYITPCAIVRDQKLIAILNKEELSSIKIEVLPDVEENFYKKKKYNEDVKSGVGKTKEYEDISKHPLRINDVITALEKDWIVLEIYERNLDTSEKRHYLLKHRGVTNGNYVYRVFNNTVGERWLLIQSNEWSIYKQYRFREGNMELFDYMDLNEKGYIFSKIN